MKKTIFFSVLALAWTASVFYACKKQPVQNQVMNGKQDISTITCVASNQDMLEAGISQVKVINGLLEFNDIDHFNNTVNYLINSDNTWIVDKNDTVFWVDSVENFVLPLGALDAFEQSIGFTSYRGKMENEKINLMKQGKFDPATYQDNYPIRDDYTRSVINPLGEVKICTSIFKYVDRRYIVEIADGDFGKLQDIRDNGFLPVKWENVYVHDLRDGVVITRPEIPKPSMPSIINERGEIGHCGKNGGGGGNNGGGYVCGNGYCEGKNGENSQNCPGDCGTAYYCGNGICEALIGENSKTCPGDCGKERYCGNKICETLAGENRTTCPEDCNPLCGNGICEYHIGENEYTCPNECFAGGRACDVEILSFTGAAATNAGCAALTWDFSVILENKPNYLIDVYDWDFGDGTQVTTLVADKTHTYAAAGMYTVKVKVTAYKTSGSLLCDVDEETIDISAGVSPKSCDQSVHWTGAWYGYANKRKYYYEVYQDVGILRNVIGAKTINYKQTWLLGWVYNPAGEIRASHEGVYYEDNCSSAAQPTSEFNRHKDWWAARCSHEIGSKFGTKKDEVHSNHWVRYDGVTYEKNLTLDVNPECP